MKAGPLEAIGKKIDEAIDAIGVFPVRWFLEAVIRELEERNAAEKIGRRREPISAAKKGVKP